MPSTRAKYLGRIIVGQDDTDPAILTDENYIRPYIAANSDYLLPGDVTIELADAELNGQPIWVIAIWEDPGEGVGFDDQEE